MIGRVFQMLDSRCILMYDKIVFFYMPVIQSHLNTPAIHANENTLPKPESKKSI